MAFYGCADRKVTVICTRPHSSSGNSCPPHTEITSWHVCKEHSQWRHEVRHDHPVSQRPVQQHGFRNEKVLRWADACQRLPREPSPCPTSPSTTRPVTRVRGDGGAYAGEPDVRCVRTFLPLSRRFHTSDCCMHRLRLRTRFATASEHSTHPMTPPAKRTQNTDRTSPSTTQT